MNVPPELQNPHIEMWLSCISHKGSIWASDDLAKFSGSIPGLQLKKLNLREATNLPRPDSKVIKVGFSLLPIFLSEVEFSPT